MSVAGKSRSTSTRRKTPSISLRKSARSSLRGEEKIATYLSAGVDSAILLESIRGSGFETTAFTAGFGMDSDEIHHAAQIAKGNGTPHIPVILHEDDLENLHRVVAQMELPVGDALILAFDKLAAAAADHGYRVAIGGDGIDESMMGYSFQSHLAKIDSLPTLALPKEFKLRKGTNKFLWRKLTSTPASKRLKQPFHLPLEKFRHSR